MADSAVSKTSSNTRAKQSRRVKKNDAKPQPSASVVQPPVKRGGKTRTQKKDPMQALTKCLAFLPPTSVAGNETLSALSQSGGITSSKEIRMSFTDYFDTSDDAAAAYFQWMWNPSQSVFSTGTATSGGFVPSYALGADLYALPKFALDSASSSVLVVTTVPVIAGNSSLTAAGNSQSTLILPTSVQKWVKVGSWRASKLFDSSEYLPAIETDTGNQPVFSGVCLDPDTLAVTAANLQMKIVIHLAQALPPVVKMGFGSTNSANAGCLHSPIGGITTTAKDCLVQVTGMSDTI